MTPERQQQINAALAAVLDLEPSDRVQYLDTAFEYDSTLRHEVERLLSESDRFLQAPAWIVDDVPLYLPDFRNGDSHYSRIEYIGHGGMGIVYKAYHSNFDKWVALKVSSPTHLISTKERDRFRIEAQSMAKLRHPNIVTVQATGEYENRPYFVMELVEGTQGHSLNDRLAEYAERPGLAAELIEAVSLAVHHAHQRRILHNDLKPANILLDKDGQPYVTDFGLARALGGDAGTSATGAIEGTAAYMSPEQAEGREVTTASDVYGLGALLYTLLCGIPPFQGATVQDTLQLVRTAIPRPPSAMNARVDKTLQAICLKCLQKDPSRRYASANGVAQDLIRYRTGQETTALPWTRQERLVFGFRRNMIQAGLVAAVIAIWIGTLVMALSVAQSRKKNQLDAALEAAASTGADLAAATRTRLDVLSRQVEEAAEDPILGAYLIQDDRQGLEAFVTKTCGIQNPQFTTCYIANSNGTMLAHYPRADIVDKDYGWRDWSRGAEELGSQRKHQSYISLAYRGTSDKVYKFAISAPVFDRKNRPVGVIATSISTDAYLDPVFTRAGRTAVLISPEDIEAPGQFREPKRFVVLFHPAYKMKGVEPIEFPDAGTVSARGISSDRNYLDPVAAVAKEYEGRWITGAARVDRTEFIVMVQQRPPILESSTLWRLAIWSTLASLVAFTIMLTILWRWVRSRKAGLQEITGSTSLPRI